MKQNWTNLMKQITADLCHLPKDFLSPLCFHVQLLPMDKSETNRKNDALTLAQFSYERICCHRSFEIQKND